MNIGLVLVVIGLACIVAGILFKSHNSQVGLILMVIGFVVLVLGFILFLAGIGPIVMPHKALGVLHVLP